MNENLISKIAKEIKEEKEGQIVVFRRQIYDWLENYAIEFGVCISEAEAVKIVERVLREK